MDKAHWSKDVNVASKKGRSDTVDAAVLAKSAGALYGMYVLVHHDIVDGQFMPASCDGSTSDIVKA